ncbi:uncharacterized protein LOC135471164 [Liolophura sinensis]|uniref:uncharacterized protein LOC135471164 n=1 Tax=Liolophura sinensis TaxID=3198878 RepID=UPI0031589D10
MAVEGVEFGVEVDSTYSSVAASWFTFTNVINNTVKADKNETKDAVPKKKRDTAEILKEVHVKEPDKHGRNLSSFIDEKVTKKLKKSKRKEQQEDEEKSCPRIKAPSLVNTEEDSKTAVIVKKKTKPSHDALPSHSIGSLTKRLESDSLSQSTRKRLKKRLNKLIKESGTDEKLKSASSPALPAKDEDLSLFLSSSTLHEIKIRESSSLKRKLEEDMSKKEEDSSPIKRKKKKKRSRQKNIKKDNRPDHMKPPHLRSNPSEAQKAVPLSSIGSIDSTIVKEKLQINSVNKPSSTSLTSPRMKNKE